MSSNNKTSLLISSQVPAFVRDQHELFVQFLEYYYKFLEQELGVMNETKIWHRRLDVDFAVDQLNKATLVDLRAYEYITADTIDYTADTTELTADIGKIKTSELSQKKIAYNTMMLQNLYDQYIKLIPENVIADKALILKHAKDFYRARGAEKSVRFLTRALFGKESYFYYPKVDVLKASDGKWFIQKSLKITDVEVGLVSANGEMDLETVEANNIAAVNFTKHKVIGETTNASATVETTNSFYENNKLVVELQLSSQISDFTNGEKVFSDFEENGLVKRVQGTLYSGIVSSYNIINGGYGYRKNDIIPLISNTGYGAEIVISKVTLGGVRAVGIYGQGAGFKDNDPILFTGGGGIGATGRVIQVDTSGTVHPNSYNIVSDTISLEANTPLGNAVYTNLNSSNANTVMANAFSYWSYSNCGPLLATIVNTAGKEYTSDPTMDVSSNNIIRNFGILARLDIISRGSGYANGDIIQFINLPQTFGSGANANVTVNATGAIVKTNWIKNPGEFVGGSGYDQLRLPIANVITSTGANANIKVSAILGDGENLFSVTDKAGVIQELEIRTGGFGYIDPPILDFSSLSGKGANANVTVVSGVYTYPGRYISDAGHVSAFNFLQDRDYYQNYSYVVRINESINKYRKVLHDLTHPIGSKMFGEYMVNLPETINVATTTDTNTAYHPMKFAQYQMENFSSAGYTVKMLSANAVPYIFTAAYFANTIPSDKVYTTNKFSIFINDDTHSYKPGSNVYLQFINPIESNVVNGLYTIQSANLTHYIVAVANGKMVSDPPNVTGQVLSWNPIMFFQAPGHSLKVGDKTRLIFANSDPRLANDIYYIKTTTTSSFTVDHDNVAYISASSGNVNVYTNRVTVKTVGDHEFELDQKLYIRYTSGDTANAVNGYYSISAVPTDNTVLIGVTNMLMQNTRAIVHTRKSSYLVTSHNLTNTSNVDIVFSNTDFSRIYPISVVNANAFEITTDVPMTTNGTAHVYKSNVTYANATITRANHGFQEGNVIYTFFDSSIVNTFYTVANVANANVFTINAMSVNVSSEINMVGNVEIGLYK